MNESQKIFDLVIEEAAFLVTSDSSNQVLQDCSIGISAGKIAAISTKKKLHGARVFHAQNKLIAPGLVNSHTHLAMSLLRGWAEGLDLQGFLERVWAAEGTVMNHENVIIGSRLGALEALKSGTTTVLDMYLFPDAAHEGAVRTGIRHISGPIFFDFPGLDGMNWTERIIFARNWHNILKELGGPQVPIFLMPHSTYTVSPEHLKDIAELAQEIGAHIHIHASENLNENAEVLKRYEKTPTRVLADAGILNSPVSNLKLGSGLADIKKYLRQDIDVSLGTDGCSSSNDLDMWIVMRLAALLISQIHGPNQLSAGEVFRLATIGGAKAVGMEYEIGSIEVGKSADIIAIDLNQPHMTPVHDVFSQLIFSAGKGDVSDVWVDGKHVISNRESTLVDFAALNLEVARIKLDLEGKLNG
jgi:5-methylthioadenosine/S-adenosylhomocysteine deaminase